MFYKFTFALITYVLFIWSVDSELNPSSDGLFETIDNRVDLEKEIIHYERLIDKALIEANLYKFDTNARRYKPKDPNKTENFGTFDFIIVGAGASGCVIASRLSEIKEWKVLLLEAGEFPNEVTDMPALSWAALSSDYNWGFYSTPQEKGCLGFEEKRCSYPRGRGVGGSTLVNALMLSRGNPADFDKLAALGNPGWSYKDVLPYFLKSEDFNKTNPQAPVNWKYHHKGGLFPAEYNNIKNSRSQAYLKAHIELGYNLTDYNSPYEVGASPIQFNLRGGKRFDTGTSFIKPFLSRPNLKVMTNSYVTKVKISPVTKVATGVHFTHENKNYFAKARLEVIVSGGTLQSPQLLMLSGVGPKDHLEEVGIEVIQDLEVGSSLRDHVSVSTLFTHNATDDIFSTRRQDIIDYIHERGRLTSFQGLSCLSFLPSKFATDKTYPDLEYTIMPFFLNSIPIQNQVIRYTLKSAVGLGIGVGLRPFFLSYIVYIHTESKGNVRLKNKDPFEYPLINPNILSNDKDIDGLYEGVVGMRKLLSTDAFKKINARFAPLLIPKCGPYDETSKTYWTCVFRELAFPTYHPISTCPMGPDSRNGSVVDASLKVHGVNNLRVADASIFPFPFSNHPMATCVMLGEKLSDMLKKQYNKL